MSQPSDSGVAVGQIITDDSSKPVSEAEQDGVGYLLGLLNQWSHVHGVDEDLGLLICATAAAHAAGPQLNLYSPKKFYPLSAKMPAPTLVADARDSGFASAVKAALRSISVIEQELVSAQPPAVRPKKVSLTDAQMLMRHQIRSQEKAISEMMGETYLINPNEVKKGQVRFLLGAALPARPLDYLKKCHLYSAIFAGQILRPPHGYRSRKAWARRLSSVVAGLSGGRFSVRGFVRFSAVDLECFIENHKYLMLELLPVVSLGKKTLRSCNDETKGELFDRMHSEVCGQLVEQRVEGFSFKLEFQSEEVQNQFDFARNRYRQVGRSVGHRIPSTDVLADLFAWYLLRLNQTAGLEIPEQQIGEYAVSSASRIRLRVAEYCDRSDATRRARKQMQLASKLVERMRRLNGPSRRRDLARGLNNQRMDEVAPGIEKLVRLGVFNRSEGWLTMATSVDDHLPSIEDFMEQPRDVPHSTIRRLEVAESLYAREESDMAREYAESNLVS